jgi:hypothetical protein
MHTRSAQPEFHSAVTSPELQMHKVISLVHMASDRWRESVEAFGLLHSRPEPPPSFVEVPPLQTPLRHVAAAQPAPTFFDEVVAAVSNGSLEMARERGALPPQSRFRVRTVPVGRPHRATKRDYDYFGELNARIAGTGKPKDLSAAG